MVTTLHEAANGITFGVACDSIVIGCDPEMADMSNPNGDIWGRQYTLCVTLAGANFYYLPRIGFREEGLEMVHEDLVFFLSLDSFHPAYCADFKREDHVPFDNFIGLDGYND
jgi:hypothetical protein